MKYYRDFTMKYFYNYSHVTLLENSRKRKNSDIFIKIMFVTGGMAILIPILSISIGFLLNFFGDYFSYFTFVKCYFLTIYGYFIGATIFYFVIKPACKNFRRNAGNKKNENY